MEAEQSNSKSKKRIIYSVLQPHMLPTAVSRTVVVGAWIATRPFGAGAIGQKNQITDGDLHGIMHHFNSLSLLRWGRARATGSSDLPPVTRRDLFFRTYVFMLFIN